MVYILFIFMVYKNKEAGEVQLYQSAHKTEETRRKWKNKRMEKLWSEYTQSDFDNENDNLLLPFSHIESRYVEINLHD
jgi:hypothetical protein